MRLLIFSLCLLWLSSCKKNDTNSPPNKSSEPVKLTLSVTEASPYQYISLQLPANTKPADINAKSVQLNIGNALVTAYADSAAFANTVYLYHLMVPELPIGDQKLTMKIAEGKLAEATITIRSFTKIADVSSYIHTWQASAQKEITDAGLAYDAQVQAGSLRKSTADSIKAFMQEAFDKNQKLIDALPQEEKTVFAQLMEANKAWINEYKSVFVQNPLSNYRVGTQGDCEEFRYLQKQYENAGYSFDANFEKLKAEQCEAAREKARLEATGKFTAKMKEAFEAAKKANKETTGKLSGAWAFVSTFVSEAAKGLFETATGLDDLNDPFAALKIDDTKQQRIAANEFIVDKEYDFSAGVTLVNMNRQNAGQFTGFSEMIKVIDDYKLFIAEIGRFLPFTPSMEVPTANSSVLYVSGYTIDQVSDPRISVQLKNGGKGKLIKLTLNSPVNAGSIDFTFRVNIATNFGSVSKVISATARVPEPASIAVVSGNNQSGPANTNLLNPLIVVVKDATGQPMTGVTVSWSVTAGGGQLTSATTATGSNGQASNTWKLGVSGTQTLTATVKKADGTNIAGSPVMFTATTSTLSITISRNGTAISGTATGGMPPYQYSLQSYTDKSAYSANNVQNITYNGGYVMTVKDATGATATAGGCVNDITITNVSVVNTNMLSVSWASPLGLKPSSSDFVFNTNNNWWVHWWVLSSNVNDPYYHVDNCTGGPGSGYGLANLGTSGTDFNRTVLFRLKSSSPAGSNSISFRAAQSCSGIEVCPGFVPTTYFSSQTYSLTW